MTLVVAAPSAFVDVIAAPAAEVAARGAGLQLVYGFYDSPFGMMVAARTAAGLCYLGFDSTEGRIARKWLRATLLRDDKAVAADCADVLAVLRGGVPPRRIVLHLFGTAFQMQVWRALLDVKFGRMMSYEDLACAIGRPQSARAVGNAVGANPVSVLVPCHRIVRKDGVLGHYGWGPSLKKALLDMESRARV